MATYSFDLEEAGTRLPDLVDKARNGSEVVITRGREPVAKLVAVDARPERRFGSARGLIELADDFDEPLEEFRELRS